MEKYVAPDPTPEQIENAAKWGFDPYDLCGSLPLWDLRNDHPFAAAGTNHDERAVVGGTPEQAARAAKDFEDDCEVLLEYEYQIRQCGEVRYLELLVEKDAFAAIVYADDRKYWSATDRNTDITRAQGAASKLVARQWINQCAAAIGRSPRYAEASNA